MACCRSIAAVHCGSPTRARRSQSHEAAITYYPHTQAVPEGVCAKVLNRPYSITADVEIPKGGAEGVLLSAGTVQGGYTFYVKDGKLRYAYNYVGSNLYRIESNTEIPEGRHKLGFEFELTGKPDIPHGKGAPGLGKLYIDGKLAGQGEIPLTMPLALGLGSGIIAGADSGAPVTPDYRPPFEFTGTLYSVTVDVSGELIEDKEAAMRHVLARQ